MSSQNPWKRLNALAGLPSGYVDAWGNERVVSDDVRRATLAAMGLPADTPDAVDELLARLTARLFGALLPPVVVAREDGGKPVIPVHVPAGAERSGQLEWTVTCEDGSRIVGAVDLATLPTLDDVSKRDSTARTLARDDAN